MKGKTQINMERFKGGVRLAYIRNIKTLQESIRKSGKLHKIG